MYDINTDFMEILGTEVLEIHNKMASNTNLCKLLCNTDIDPFSGDTPTPAQVDARICRFPLSDEENFNGGYVFYKPDLISTTEENNEYLTCLLEVIVLIHKKQLNIKHRCDRLLLTMAEIRKSINKKKCKGIGTLKFQTATYIVYNNDIIGYRMVFTWAEHDT